MSPQLLRAPRGVQPHDPAMEEFASLLRPTLSGPEPHPHGLARPAPVLPNRHHLRPHIPNGGVRQRLLQLDITSRSLPPGVTRVRGCTTAFCHGFLYCIIDEVLSSKLSGVIAYDLHLSVWSSMLITLPAGFGEARSSNSFQPGSLAASLVECRGHVMLVAEKLQLGTTLVFIFELQLMNITWLEVASLPQGGDGEFESFKQGLRCDGVVVHGSLICLTSQSGDMAALDLETGRWGRLPECPLAVGQAAEGIDVAVFPFLPSLEAQV